MICKVARFRTSQMFHMFQIRRKKRKILTQNQFANRRVRQKYFQSAALLFFTVDEDESRQKII